MALTPSDVQKISDLCEVKHTDSWSLIMDLEHNMVICEENMTAFIEKLKKHKLYQAVKALTEDIPKPPSNSGQASDIPNISSNSGNRFGKDIPAPKSPSNPEQASYIPKSPSNSGQASDIPNTSSNSGNRFGEAFHLGLKRRRIDEPGQKPHLDMIDDLLRNIESLPSGDIPEFSTKLKSIYMYLKNINLHIDDISKGSIVFHLSVYDPYALMNLWEIHSSRELIKDLAKLIVPDDLREDFIKEWKTVVDKEEYESALMRLKERVQYDSFYGIISDDIEWESQMVVELTQRRPDFMFSILKHWRLCKPETINDLIAKSRKLITAFSPKPLTEYSKYAAHSVVVQMLEAKALDDAKIIPIKISEDSVVPPVFASFTVINASEEHFVDKVLQDLDEYGKYWQLCYLVLQIFNFFLLMPSIHYSSEV
ncbi:uncharacterized protein LOC117119412 [Anneissia japonica]|uniref:uncharacterized protein LOC117119412 n=1 Tax=Anneissia japonica TaxID=1529436 RepID=UPI0014259418|nr:uncharacterized protein LOC117119412 [Anneissia japonica]